MVGAVMNLGTQLAITYVAPSTALNHVFGVSFSSWLQEHTSDIAHSLCHVFPPLATYLLPRTNPLALLSAVGFASIFVMDLMIEIK